VEHRNKHSKHITMKTITLLAIALITACAAPSAKADSCRPYITHTCVVHSRTECRWATDHCGHRYSYEVRVVTYRSHYSNGQSSTFTKTYRA
jgi:hypothetical protein